MRQYNRIFGIGFHRTCTTSLAESLECLGIPAFHWQEHNRLWEAIKNSAWDASVWNEKKAYTDLPIPSYYQELDKAFPDSLFVLTVRKNQQWKNSLKKHLRKRSGFDGKWYIESSKMHRLERLLYDCWDGSITIEECEDSYTDHNKKVIQYFANRQDSLLVIDLTEAGQWNKLANFFDCPMPKENFPHLNASS